ncbi:MAG: hypothetical protein SGJ20_00935 [Planctomycetota bacterium]|nr:hypothetical protein [Planctomycetota bacterium]
MKIFIWIVGIFVGLFLLLWMNTIRGSFAVNRRLNRMIAPVISALMDNSSNATELVSECASNPATRNRLHTWLTYLGKVEAFPKEYRTMDMIAESDFVHWLMHPNELKSAPDEIELVHSVEVIDGERQGWYFLYRFRVDPPHWASDRSWMAGIAGPFWEDDSERDSGRDTFSEFKSYESHTDSEHIEILKAAVRKRGLTMPS